jgi:hypothetical protein
VNISLGSFNTILPDPPPNWVGLGEGVNVRDGVNVIVGVFVWVGGGVWVRVAVYDGSGVSVCGIASMGGGVVGWSSAAQDAVNNMRYMQIMNFTVVFISFLGV